MAEVSCSISDVLIESAIVMESFQSLSPGKVLRSFRYINMFTMCLYVICVMCMLVILLGLFPWFGVPAIDGHPNANSASGRCLRDHMIQAPFHTQTRPPPPNRLCLYITLYCIIIWYYTLCSAILHRVLVYARIYISSHQHQVDIFRWESTAIGDTSESLLLISEAGPLGSMGLVSLKTCGGAATLQFTSYHCKVETLQSAAKCCTDQLLKQEPYNSRKAVDQRVGLVPIQSDTADATDKLEVLFFWKPKKWSTQISKERHKLQMNLLCQIQRLFAAHRKPQDFPDCSGFHHKLQF